MNSKSQRSLFRSTARRGTAEIELLLSIIVLISILMLVVGTVHIGMARLNTVEDAAYRALGNAATGGTPLYTNDPALSEITTIADIRPGMPNRTHVVVSQKQVSVSPSVNQTLPPTNVHAYAGAISPAWTFSAYPAIATDSQATQTWFETYVTESHQELIDPLVLAPPWAP